MDKIIPPERMQDIPIKVRYVVQREAKAPDDSIAELILAIDKASNKIATLEADKDISYTAWVMLEGLLAVKKQELIKKNGRVHNHG